MDEYLNIDELSKYLGIKKATLYFKVENGQIPHYKIGRLIRFKKSEIDSWMQSMRQALSTTDLKTKEIIKRLKNKKSIDVAAVMKKAVEQEKAREYNFSHGKPGHLGEEA